MRRFLIKLLIKCLNLLPEEDKKKQLESYIFKESSRISKIFYEVEEIVYKTNMKDSQAHLNFLDNLNKLSVSY